MPEEAGTTVQERPKLSVIILNHNSGTMLADCLTSLFEDDIPFGLEVIVPDNVSTDNSLDLAREKWGERIRIIPTGANNGFAWGNNIGIRAANGEFVSMVQTCSNTARRPFSESFSASSIDCRSAGCRYFNAATIPSTIHLRGRPYSAAVFAGATRRSRGESLRIGSRTTRRIASCIWDTAPRTHRSRL